MSEKTEKATPYKLRKAKEKGQVSKSVELNISIFLIIMLATTLALWPSLLQEIKALMIHLFYLAGRMSFSFDNLGLLQKFVLGKLISLWLPFALTTLLCTALATIAQTGFVWSTQALSPNFKRLNLAQGFKRLFSSKLVFDTVKNLLKLSFAFLLLYLCFHHEIDALLKLVAHTPNEQPQLIIHLLTKLVLALLILLFALALMDKIYTRWKYAKDNRMSKQEVKDEYRQREGDPKIKTKLRQLQQQLRQKIAALEQVKTADVVITNPSHLAIALQYQRGSMPAPKVVCKAQGEMVKQVKALARQYSVPIIENKAFARALFASVELNQWIQQEHFPIAAMILREVYRQRERLDA